MYTFQALADIPVKHDGFFIIAFFAVILLVMVLFNEPESFFVWFFIMCIPVSIAYGVSYHWTNQTPKTFANEKVVGKFVGYQPEGYNEKSGKSRADRHYMYVVYEVPAGLIVLKAQEGTTYPKEAVLYKN